MLLRSTVVRLLALLLVVLWALLVLCVVLTIAACAHKPPQVIPVAIVAWPAPGRVECEIDELPAEPEPPEWPTVDEDFFRRQYVNRVDYDKLFDYLHLKHIRDQQVADCLRKFTHVPE